MTKKLIWILVIFILLLAGAGVVYWRLSHLHPAPPSTASHWPSLPSTSERAPAPQPNVPEAPAPEKPPPKESATEGSGFILRQGETLEYEANFTKLNSTVANLKIVAVEKRETGTKGSWHLEATVHTENPYRMVFPLDDQFDSYSVAGSMTSFQYEMHLNERGQKVDTVERLLSSPNEPAPFGTSAARVLPGTRDPLGMLEYLRGVDWSRTNEVRSPVYDGRKLYDVRAVLAGNAPAVAVPAGKFNTMKIEIHVMEDGVEMKDAHFLLYLTNDSTRLPVLMEAVLPIATARVELTKMK